MQNLLWPSIRWQDDLAPELAGLYEQNLTPHFFTQASDVPDEIWRTCDAILGPPVSPKHMEKLDRCRIYVKPAVGYDEIDLAAWADLGIPVCNTPIWHSRSCRSCHGARTNAHEKHRLSRRVASMRSYKQLAACIEPFWPASIKLQGRHCRTGPYRHSNCSQIEGLRHGRQLLRPL